MTHFGPCTRPACLHARITFIFTGFRVRSSTFQPFCINLNPFFPRIIRFRSIEPSIEKYSSRLSFRRRQLNRPLSLWPSVLAIHFIAQLGTKINQLLNVSYSGRKCSESIGIVLIRFLCVSITVLVFFSVLGTTKETSSTGKSKNKIDF